MILADIVDSALAWVPSWLAYVLVLLIPLLEASIFLGFFFPGETMIVLGGVLAYQGRAELSAVLALAITGAIVGDSVGYWVGHRYGRTLQQTRAGQVVGDDRWQRAEGFLRDRGGRAVFFGRFTALLRALVPAAAGMSHIHYRRTFLVWNVIGGTAWATAFVLVGYLAGDAYKRAEHYAGRGSFVLLVLVVLAFVWRELRKRRRERLLSASDQTIHDEFP